MALILNVACLRYDFYYYSTVLKRNVMEDGLGTVGGTEEPLETSANGLDSGSVATFFRDRKSTGKDSFTENSEKDTR